MSLIRLDTNVIYLSEESSSEEEDDEEEEEEVNTETPGIADVPSDGKCTEDKGQTQDRGTTPSDLLTKDIDPPHKSLRSMDVITGVDILPGAMGYSVQVPGPLHIPVQMFLLLIFFAYRQFISRYRWR